MATDASVQFSDKSYKLTDLVIYSSLGGNQFMDITYIMGELTIFEDIYSPAMAGNVIIPDSQNFIAMLPLLGNEFIYMKLTSVENQLSGNKAYTIEKTFRIYKIDNVGINYGTLGAQIYRINFCSEEQFISQSTRISKSYKGKTVSEMVKDIVKTYLNPDKTRYSEKNITDTKEKYDLIVPFMNPFQAIQWATARTTPPAFFYESNDGFFMLTINDFFQQPVNAKYYYSIPNVIDPNEDNSSPSQVGKVIKFEVVNMFDTLRGIEKGMFSSRLRTVDPIRQQHNIVNYDYLKEFGQLPHITDTKEQANPFINDLQNRFGKQLNENFNSLNRYFITTKDHNTTPNISGKQPNINPNLVEQWMLPRISTIEQLNYFRLKLVAPGNVHLNAGDTITFDFPNIKQKDYNQRDVVPRYSGKYLVTAIRHKINFDHYEIVMEVVKDCVNDAYGNAGNGDSNIVKSRGL